MAGPYGNWGSRKYLMASLDQSLRRMNLDYVDIFYHHRPDPNTPMEETMGALDQIVRSGKALYVGVSNYNAEQTREAVRILRSLGTPLLILQAKYSMFVRTPEEGLQDVLRREGVGMIAFSPLNNGVLTDKYLHGIPADSRAGHDPRYLKPEMITPEKLRKVKKLNEMARARGAEPCPDGAALGAAGSGGDLRADRRESPGADSGEPARLRCAGAE